MQEADILILSNGPGEVTTWVRPVVRALRQQLGEERSLVRISVILSPCPNATGKEAAIAQSYPEVDRVQGAEHFFPFLLWGKTVENWDWRKTGVVVFLGGDQIFPVVIGKRLGYRTVVYAEWEARWHAWVDRFGVMKPDLIAKIPHKYADKFAVVGDLMADVGLQVGRLQVESSDLPSNLQPLQTWATPRCANNLQPSNLQPLQTWATPRCANNLQPSNLQPSNLQPLQTFNLQPSNLQLSNIEPSTELIGLLPGSKPAKLAQGVPLTLAIAQHIHAAKPQTRFVIPVAPTLDISALARFADPQHNPLIHQLGWGEAELVVPTADTDNKTLLKTTSGLCIELWQEFPAYELLSQCCICLTTVGANTAELGSLAVPMLVLLPTQQLDAMRAWDGIPGLLVRLPGIGQSLAKIINFIIIQQVVRQKRLFAWPNIWAKKEIVPELFGKIQPQDVARLVLDYLEHPEKLEEMRSRLRAVRGQPGAAQKLAQLVREELYQ